VQFCHVLCFVAHSPRQAFLRKKLLFGMTPLKAKGLSYAKGSAGAELEAAAQGLAIGQFRSRQGTFVLPPSVAGGDPTNVQLLEFVLKMDTFNWKMLATTGDLQTSRRIRAVYVGA
jgi:hypothetical protein